MNVRFLAPAQDELTQAVNWYDKKAPELGQRFLRTVEEGIERISQWPQSQQAFGDNIRRCLLPPFPYALIYAQENEEIIIIAVAHLHRKPGYWAERTGQDNDEN